jgi:hypothetical protein
MTEPFAPARKWTRLEYERPVEAEFLGPEDKGGLYARAGIVVDYWIVNIPNRRLEIYREPEPDETAAFGWRYGRSITLGPDERVAPLAAPQAAILIADLLP